jgi:hypothetical protein
VLVAGLDTGTLSTTDCKSIMLIPDSSATPTVGGGGLQLCWLAFLDNCISVKTATEMGVRAIQDCKVIEWNTCWKCRLSEGTDDM